MGTDIHQRARELETDLLRSLEEIERERTRVVGLLNGVRTFLAGDANRTGRDLIGSAVSPARVFGGGSSQHNFPTAAGLPEGITRRQAIQDAISEFGGSTFTVNDVIQKHLTAYPRDDSNNLRHDVSRILRQKVRDDELKLVKKAEKPPESNIYQDEARKEKDSATQDDVESNSISLDGKIDDEAWIRDDAHEETRLDDASSERVSLRHIVREQAQKVLADPNVDVITQTVLKQSVLRAYPDVKASSLRRAISKVLNELVEQGKLELADRGTGGSLHKYSKRGGQ